MIRKIFTGFILLLLLVQQLPPVGTPAGTKIYNGGDRGVAGVADIEGDIVLSYSTDLFSDTYTTSEVTEVIVSSGYAIAPLPSISSPWYVSIGKQNFLLYNVCNLANTVDSFVIELSTLLPTGWRFYLLDDDNQDKLHNPNETTVFNTIEIPPDTTHYFFITIELSSDVPYGTTVDLSLQVKNQAGAATEDNWFNNFGDDVRIVTFTAVAISPEIRANIPIPMGLKIINSTDTVKITWSVYNFSDLAGFVIYKGDSIETLASLSPTDVYASTSATCFIDNKSTGKVWYKIKTVDKYFNLSEDSMFISSDGELVSLYYNNKTILAMYYTTQKNNVLYKETNSLGANLHIKIVKLPEEKTTDIALFEIKCYYDGLLYNEVNNIIELDANKSLLEIYYNKETVKQKINEEEENVIQRLSMFYYNNVEWNNIGGSVYNDKVVNNVNYSGKYKIAVISKTKQFEVVSITPKKFFSPLEQPPFNKFSIVVKHKKTIKPVCKIFNLTGKEVVSLTPSSIQQGDEFATSVFIWDGKDSHGRSIRSGIYLYQIESNDGVINGTVIVVK